MNKIKVRRSNYRIFDYIRWTGDNLMEVSKFVGLDFTYLELRDFLDNYVYNDRPDFLENVGKNQLARIRNHPKGSYVIQYKIYNECGYQIITDIEFDMRYVKVGIVENIFYNIYLFFRYIYRRMYTPFWRLKHNVKDLIYKKKRYFKKKYGREI